MSMMAHALDLLQLLHLAEVVDNEDPEKRGRIQVELLANRNVKPWASVVSQSAGVSQGRGYGTSFIPRLHEIVVLAFVPTTPAKELPLILGSVWSGQSSSPENVDPVQDHYVVRTPKGTVMEFDDSDGNGPKLEIQTPQGHKITVTDGNGGEIEILRGSQSVKLTATGIDIKSSVFVNVEAGTMLNIKAPLITVDAGMSRFSGVVQADTVISNSVVSASYTPGAGNIW